MKSINRLDAPWRYRHAAQPGYDPQRVADEGSQRLMEWANERMPSQNPYSMRFSLEKAPPRLGSWVQRV
jgi:hypothetical protein